MVIRHLIGLCRRHRFSIRKDKNKKPPNPILVFNEEYQQINMLKANAFQSISLIIEYSAKTSNIEKNENYSDNFEDNKNIMDNDAPAPAIAPNDPVSDLSDNFEKMKLADKLENPFKIILNKEKKNDERIFTNNIEDHLGDYYID